MWGVPHVKDSLTEGPATSRGKQEDFRTRVRKGKKRCPHRPLDPSKIRNPKDYVDFSQRKGGTRREENFLGKRTFEEEPRGTSKGGTGGPGRWKKNAQNEKGDHSLRRGRHTVPSWGKFFCNMWGHMAEGVLSGPLPKNPESYTKGKKITSWGNPFWAARLGGTGNQERKR